MALRDVRIHTRLVGNYIGNSSDEVIHLVLDPTVNKWSKYKPVRGEFPISSNKFYGFDLPSSWQYLPPRGDYILNPSEPCRIDDFRGYEHDQAETLPPAYVKLSTSSFYPGNSTEGENDAVFAPDVSGQLSLNDNGVAGPSAITLSDIEITPGVFLSDYYFGMRVSSTYTYYKTYYDVGENKLAANGQVMSVNLFTGLPQLVDELAGCTVYFFLSLTPTSPTDAWTNTPPSGIIYLPHEEVDGFQVITYAGVTFNPWMLSDGRNGILTPEPIPELDRFDVTNWWDNTNDIKPGKLITSNINSDWAIGGYVVYSKPAWLDARMYNNVDKKVEDPPYYGVDSEDNQNPLYLQVKPNSPNNGGVRGGNIMFTLSSTTKVLLTIAVTQEGDISGAEITFSDHTSPAVTLTNLHFTYAYPYLTLYYTVVGPLPGDVHAIPAYINIYQSGIPDAIYYNGPGGSPYMISDSVNESQYSVDLSASESYYVVISEVEGSLPMI